MIACTKARRFPGVRCCTSRTMAVLPLYLIAIPLRRSFAADIEVRFLVDSLALYKSYRAELTESRNHMELKGRFATHSEASVELQLSRTERLVSPTDGSQVSRTS